MLLRNKKSVLIIIFLLLLNTNIIHAQDWEEKESNYEKEFLGATVGHVVTGITAMTLTVLVEPIYFTDHFFSLAIGGYLVGGMLGTPLGTLLTGKIIQEKGSVLGSSVGGVIGTSLGLLATYYMFGKEPQQELIIPTILILPPLCSVIGYNIFPHKNDFQSSVFPQNLPAIGLLVLPEKHGDKISPKIGANVTFRF